MSAALKSNDGKWLQRGVKSQKGVTLSIPKVEQTIEYSKVIEATPITTKPLHGNFAIGPVYHAYISQEFLGLFKARNT